MPHPSKHLLAFATAVGVLLLLLAPRPARAQSMGASPPPTYSTEAWRNLRGVNWTDDDESWYRGNRTASVIGKILTVGGIGLIIGGAVQSREGVLWGG